MTPPAQCYWWLLRRAGALTFLAVTGLLILSPLALKRGLVHPEVYRFLPHYLGDRPVLARIFDPSQTDWGFYQARELSYVFDLIDCQVIALAVKLGYPHFLSLTHYSFCAALALLLWRFARRHLRLDAPLAGALVLLFATSPAFFLGGGYFRSAKIGAALCAMVTALLIARALASEAEGAKGRHRLWFCAAAAVSAALMSLFDRQGFALCLLAAGWLAVRAVITRSPASVALPAGITMAAGAVSVYNHFLAPRLIEHWSGFRPSMDFQQLPWRDLLAAPTDTLSIALYAPILLLDTLRFLLGGLPLALVAALLVAVWWILPPRCTWPEGRRPSAALARLWFAIIPLGLVTMNALMILRVKAMLNLDYRRIYYGLPSLVILWVLFALTAAALRQLPGWRPRWITLGVAALVACNAVGLLEHRAIIRRGLYLNQHASSEGIIAALRHLDRVAPEKAHPPFWPNPPDAPAEDDGVVRFFRYRQLQEANR